MIKLEEEDQYDFENFARALKKAGRKGELKEFDATYMATVLLSKIFGAGMLKNQGDMETIDKAVGVLMILSSSLVDDTP